MRFLSNIQRKYFSIHTTICLATGTLLSECDKESPASNYLFSAVSVDIIITPTC